MNDVAICEVRPADTEQLLELMRLYWQYEGIAAFDALRLREQLKNFLCSPTYGCGWMAQRAGLALGYVLFSFVYSFEHAGLIAEVDELFVASPWRQQGIGQALLEAARGGLIERGCLTVQMQVADDNLKAQQFYTRLGFKEKRGYRLWLSPLRSDGEARAVPV